MSETINNGIPFVPENTIDPAAGLNLALNDIDALLQLRVVTFGLTVPPTGVEGQRHIVGVGATGDWAGQDNRMALFQDGLWRFKDAYYCTHQDTLWTYDGTEWSEAGVAAVADHNAEPDPHPQYTTEIEAAAAAPVQSVDGKTGAVDLSGDYQPTLVSGTNIKTINGNSLLGSGDLVVTVSAGALNDLTDVTITSASNGEGIVYNGSEWVNQDVLKPSGDTIDDVTITRYRETIAVATTSIDRADGGIQTLTLTADSALTWTLNNGEKIQLYLTPDGFNVTDWGVTHWMTDVPTLATENMVVVEKVGGNIYAWDGGSR